MLVLDGALSVDAVVHTHPVSTDTVQVDALYTALIRFAFCKNEPPASVVVNVAVTEPVEVLGWTSKAEITGMVVSVTGVR